METYGTTLRPIWLAQDLTIVKVIDQRGLPHACEVVDLVSVDDVIVAIKSMVVRGAPLIGVTGAYGLYLAAVNSSGKDISEGYLINEAARLKTARPTAVNLAWAVDQVLAEVLAADIASDRVQVARAAVEKIVETEIDNCRNIGIYGVALIDEISRAKAGRPVNILTHCNAGWLACVEYGTATAPIYMAHEQGIDVHVWVDETRPLNQGARLTAWELGRQGINHTVITDNAGGHLMQHGMVDMVIVGADRTTRTGDVANKIGTYLKALAARDNHVPFYVALPSSTFDWQLTDGIGQIPIEARDPDEVRYVYGVDRGKPTQVLIAPPRSPAANFAFDVTPARLVTGFITERGICQATEEDIRRLFPERLSHNP
ncbi:MAG: S-methyl-5-thioribose-1-phosphate isomerase [Desulfobacterales bacterium]|nr:S-methyl-5-thioribose-1-phosphate isomerase [Desulfobacterales bacterium]MDD4071004.1 S-methyl-5-thioribose-1-phosphate isomerase [Desulfobacterales bacterium]MDD4391917.1 S-methyl-5-thioribose-1-phosphate isomerase [Desulfobacterales bacterium]